jgi:hypothetical protein
MPLPIATADAPAPAAAEAPQVRPEIPPAITADVNVWWNKTDNLTQRKNALWEFREANKTLFPARFNVNDPRRGQTPIELRSGKDTRRVQTPIVYRGTLQITAMTVPDDLSFSWQAKEQVKPPIQDPMLGQPTTAIDPTLTGMGDTLRICQKQLLDEAKWIEKLQAWVQDSDTYPASIIKCSFRRDYQSATLNPNPVDRDDADGIAAVQSLLEQYARKDFDQNDAKFAQLMQGLTALKEKARITRWFGFDVQLLPLDAFGILEDATDVVNMYDASAMFHDALMTGEAILARFPYKVGVNGETLGVLASELTNAMPWDTSNSTTDPNARNRASRNRQLTTPNATPVNVSSTAGMTGVDPLQRQYLVREIWCKRDRTVYTLIRGIPQFVDKYVPQKRSEQWYPFYVLPANRVPGELYGASSVELKRDIQARILRKRSDEEKARWLHLPRGVYNRSAGVDEKEMVKLQDIEPGKLRGINFGTTAQKIDDLVQWWKYDYNPESFNTMKDEQDLDLMGSLPVQAMGQTGSANFATEVSVAASGSQIATEFRKNNIKRAIDNFLACTGEELLMELTRDEVQLMGGPFSVWPEIYDEVEAAQIMEDAQARAMQTASQSVLMQVQQQVVETGAVPTPQAVAAQVESAAAPIWQSEMMQTYGGIEPMTRTSLFRRLKVEVKSTFNSRLDKQQNLQMLGILATALQGIGATAQALGQPFNMRPIVLHHAELVGGANIVDEAFPAISPMEIAKHLAQAALQTAAAPAAEAGAKADAKAPGGPPAAQGAHGSEVDPAEQADNALQSAPKPSIT